MDIIGLESDMRKCKKMLAYLGGREDKQKLTLRYTDTLGIIREN